MIKNIIFDLDGTITNSYEGIVNAVKFSLDKINFKYDESKLISFIGPPLKDSYMELGFSEDIKFIWLQVKLNLQLGKFYQIIIC